MPWFMVDDKLHGHRKRIRAGIEAMGLWCVAGSWCADHLSDGFIQDYVALDLDPKAERHAAKLVSANFWTETEQNGERGWQFHDWTGMQPTRVEVEAKREAAKERMRKVRSTRSGSRELQANEQRTDANVRESSRAVRLTPAQPSPAQPIRSSGSPSGEGSPSVPTTRPPRRCKKHINDDDPPNCGQCADARKLADSWQAPTLSAKRVYCPEHPAQLAGRCPECVKAAVPRPRKAS